MSSPSRKLLLSLLSISAFLFVPALHAQDATAKILGTVEDPSGAVIPDAAITVTNADTKVQTASKSDKNGFYQVNQLPIGNYRVTASAAGFADSTSSTYKLEINASQRVDFKMAVAGTTQTVEVNISAPAIDTVSSTVGGSVTERPLVDLPLNGRNILDLAQLQPGVTSGQNPGNTSAACANGPAGCVSISGGRTDSVTYLLDGGNNTSLIDNGVVFNPNPDAVEEFRILENDYAAEYGRNGGGVISVVSKGGTHDLHGTLFEFNRNNAYNANLFFNKRDTPVDPIPNIKRNQFGGTIGGEFFIPRVIPRKDRYFFFFSYEGQRLTQSAPPGASQVPTPLEIQGNFSQSDIDTMQAVAALLQANPFFQPNPVLAAQGIIDPTKISSVAQAYIAAKQFVSSPTGSLNLAGTTIDNFDQFNGRFDVVITQKDRLTLTLARNHEPRIFPYEGLPAIPYPTASEINAYVLNAAETHTFTPNVLNELRIVGQRLKSNQGIPVSPLPTPAQLGVGITPDQATGPTLLFFANNLTTFGSDPDGPTNLFNNTFDYSDSVSWVKGRHNLKFGFDFSPYQNNQVFDFFINGEFQFNGLPNAADGGAVGGASSFAEFLLGSVDNYFQGPSAPSNIRSKATYTYAQDEFHVTHRLTLNYGLRYEYSSPKYDTLGRTFSLNPNLQSTVFPGAPKGLLFPGDSGAPRGANFPNKTDFAPRFGFALDLFGTGKTVFRGGFGLFYDILKAEDNFQFNGQAPFFSVGNIFSCSAPGQTQCFPALNNAPTNQLQDPFGSSGVVNPFPSKPPTKDLDFAAAGFLPAGGLGTFYVDPHLHTPYTYQFNFGVQQDLGKGVIAEVAYVGSINRRYTALEDINPQQPDGTHLFQDQTGIPDNGTNPTNFNQLQEFRNVTYGNYNALQAQLRKNVGKLPYVGNTYFQLSYTYGKTLDNVSGFRQRNFFVPFFFPNLFYSRSDTDVRHRIVLSGGWDLPIDTLAHDHLKLLTKGWSLYPIASYQTGYPLDVLSENFQNFGDPGSTGFGDQQLVRANLVGSKVVKLNPYSTSNSTGPIQFAPFVDPTNFANPNDATVLPGTLGYGTLPRNAFSGPNRTNVDLSIAKVTPLFGGDKGVVFELRGDFFNAFNITQFKDPNLLLGGPLFGQISTTYDPRIIQIAGKIRF